jgi:hypothetical protein
MTIERPMFPPRAESVDSFSVQRPPGDRPDATPTGDSHKPPEGPSAAIISFPRSRPIARQYVSMPEYEYAPRTRRFAKNPLRQHVTRLSIAIVHANKLDEFIDREDLKYIRNGVEAARILADELGRLADQLEG